MPRLTVVCGCPGTDLKVATSAACSEGARLFDMDADVKAWITEALKRGPSVFGNWKVRSDKFASWAKEQTHIYGERSLRPLERHARPVTDAITECVAKMAIEALKTGGDAVLVGHMSRDDRHAVVALFEQTFAKAATDADRADRAEDAAKVAKIAAAAASRTVAPVIEAAQKADRMKSGYGRVIRASATVALAHAVRAAADACESALKAVALSDAAFGDLTSADLLLGRAEAAENAASQRPQEPAIRDFEVDARKLAPFVDDLVQVLAAARSTSQQLSAAAARSEQRRMDVGARMYGDDLERLLEAATTLADAVVASAGIKDAGDAYRAVAHVKADALQGGGRSDEEDLDDHDAELAALGLFEHEPTPAAAKPAAKPVAKPAPKPAEVLFVEVLPNKPCADYEALDAQGPNRQSTISLIEDRHKYVIGPPWIHNLGDDSTAESYGLAADGKQKCVDSGNRASAVWKYVEDQLKVTSGYGSTSGYGFSGYGRNYGF